jgi:hypothetical protein
VGRNLATTQKRDIEDLYESFGWELADDHGHMLEAFKKLLTDGTILDKYTMSEDVKDALKKNIAMRLTPQPVKVRTQCGLAGLACGLVEEGRRGVLRRGRGCIHGDRRTSGIGHRASGLESLAGCLAPCTTGSHAPRENVAAPSRGTRHLYQGGAPACLVSGRHELTCLVCARAATATQVRSDFEVTCFAYEGIDAIKAALMKGALLALVVPGRLLS